ncbi:tryptophan-rich sensory protein [bacterium]|nr:tryptophan-rich sensory protein [candidate division CSSED10-310 bacterium]
MNTTISKISPLVAYVVMVGVNYLAVLLPLGGRSTGQISDSYPNLFAPAGYAFSIWGLIYILLGVYVVYQLWQEKDELGKKVNRIFIVNALLNASWMFAWHYDLIWLSLIIMGGLLMTLIKIADVFRGRALTPKETWLVRLPFSVYFGWITVASIANVTVFLVYLGWNGLGLPESFWTVAALLVGALIGAWRMLCDRFIPYGLVLIWAYSAILYKHISDSGFAGNYPSVVWSATLCLLVFGGTIVFIIVKKNLKIVAGQP